MPALSVTLSPSLVILSEAKNLQFQLRVDSAKGLHLLFFWFNCRFFASRKRRAALRMTVRGPQNDTEEDARGRKASLALGPFG